MELGAAGGEGGHEEKGSPNKKGDNATGTGRASGNRSTWRESTETLETIYPLKELEGGADESQLVAQTTRPAMSTKRWARPVFPKETTFLSNYFVAGT